MILENYYHILGLDITATQKQIDKRGKEILKYLAIGDIPDYFDVDFLFTRKYRNETFIKDAMNGLRNPRTRLQHIFFWVNLETQEDKDVLKGIQKGAYVEIIPEIRKLKNPRNKAIFLTLLLSQEEVISKIGKQESLSLGKEAIDLWNITLTDDKKWNSFKKTFYLYDDISTNEDLIEELKKNADKILADIFFDISKIINSSDITKYFTEIFHVKGTRIHGKSEEIYLELGKISEKLENIKVSDDGVFDDTEKNQINTWIEEGKKLIAVLSELGLAKDSKTVVMQDKLTSSIRTIALDLWNNLDNENKSGIYYIKEALQIVGTEGLKSKLEDDLNTMDGEMKFSDSFKKIIKNIEGDEPEKALKEIIKLEAEITGGSKEGLMKLKKRAVFDLIGSKFIKAKKLFEDKKYSLSIGLFEEVEKLVNQYLDLFDGINRDGLSHIVNKIRKDLDLIQRGHRTSESVFNEIDATRTKLLEKLTEHEGYLVIFYIDSITYSFLSKINSRSNDKIKPSLLGTLNGCGVSIYGDTTYVTILWIPVIPLSRWSVASLGGNRYQFYGKVEMQKWKTIWQRIMFGIIGLFILFLFIESTSLSSSSSDSSYRSSSNSYSSLEYDNKDSGISVNDSMTTGKYMCSSSDYIYAESIKPKKELQDEINGLKFILDITNVDHSSQSSIDFYNEKVKTLKAKQTQYNNAVGTYNDYLKKNCTKRY